MRQFKLCLDDLAVESFNTNDEAMRGGTVKAHYQEMYATEGGFTCVMDTTCAPEHTCVMDTTCAPEHTCNATCPPPPPPPPPTGLC